jgi:hypothetical protein
MAGGRDGYRWQRMQTDAISQRKDNFNLSFIFVLVIVNMFSHVLVTLILCLFLFGCSAVECELYLAESTIPNAGLGIFSSIELNPGDPAGEGDVCIPIFDLLNHHPDPFNPFGDYVWAGEVMGMKLEVESDDIEALCPVCTHFYLSPIIFNPSHFLVLGLGLCYQLQPSAH